MNIPLWREHGMHNEALEGEKHAVTLRNHCDLRDLRDLRDE